MADVFRIRALLQKHNHTLIDLLHIQSISGRVWSVEKGRRGEDAVYLGLGNFWEDGLRTFTHPYEELFFENQLDFVDKRFFGYYCY